MLAAAVILTACGSLIPTQVAPTVFGQGDDTHGRNAAPNYARVFAQSRVNRLDLRIEPADWQALLADMQSLAGAPGQVGGGPGGGGQAGRQSGRDKGVASKNHGHAPGVVLDLCFRESSMPMVASGPVTMPARRCVPGRTT